MGQIFSRHYFHNFATIGLFFGLLYPLEELFFSHQCLIGL